MFGLEGDSNAPKYIPGYTGNEKDERFGNHNTGFFIPGYAGFVKGVKSENMYGKTFGESSAISIEGHYHKGHDLPPPIKFVSTVQESFTDQQKEKEDYFFSFTRLTKDELAKTMTEVELNRSRLPRTQMVESQGKTIDVNYDQIVNPGPPQQ